VSPNVTCEIPTPIAEQYAKVVQKDTVILVVLKEYLQGFMFREHDGHDHTHL
jgi:hypothetical protein